MRNLKRVNKLTILPFPTSFYVSMEEYKKANDFYQQKELEMLEWRRERGYEEL